MAKSNSKDLFDDSVMSFGEHLEVLRVHLWKAVIGLAIGTIACLFYGEQIIGVIRKPIDDALRRRNIVETQVIDIDRKFSFWDQVRKSFGLPVGTSEDIAETEQKVDVARERGTIEVKVKASEVARMLHELDPERYPEPKPDEDEAELPLRLSSPFFARFETVAERTARPVTLTVQEAFMTYLKVSFISGLVLSSPWVIYQLWLFVAAGLYPHERKYVYVYLPMSIVLFLGGVVFCFFAVFPFVLTFMLNFNDSLKVEPQIRLSEWISFAISLPLMFGLSFQLPLVMLFLERISVFGVEAYREKRRMAILAIAIIAMLLTPPDPLSMTTMMIPLLLLYELGIILCRFSPSKNPFEAEAA